MATKEHREHKEAERPPATLTLEFPEGSYRQALEHHFLARDWLLNNGCCFRDDLDGIINSPTYKGQKCPGGIVPEEWPEDGGWQVTVDFWTLPSATEFLRSKQLPAGARWAEKAETLKSES